MMTKELKEIKNYLTTVKFEEMGGAKVDFGKASIVILENLIDYIDGLEKAMESRLREKQQKERVYGLGPK